MVGRGLERLMASIPAKGVAFVAGWEGFRSCPYRDPVGVWTRGYGETQGISSGSRCITQAEAQANLKRRLEEDYLSAVPRVRRLKACERAALASFAYNNGAGAVSDPGISTLAKRLKSSEGRTYRKRKKIYREEIPRWVFAGGQRFEGLVKRRAAEVRLACEGDYSGRP